MKKLIFTNVYLKRISYPACSIYLVMPKQGLHLNGLHHAAESRSCSEGFFLADISYNFETKTYQLESKESVLEPSIMDIAASGARVATLLRTAGLYRAEYGGDGLTFSQMNN